MTKAEREKLIQALTFLGEDDTFDKGIDIIRKLAFGEETKTFSEIVSGAYPSIEEAIRAANARGGVVI